MSDVTEWFGVGHVTHERERTGCTVIVFDSLVPAVVDVRGGAPGTRETALLGDGMLVSRVDAIVLTGGSAFGLACVDGVMAYLRELERGLPTAAGAVPIVPAAVIYDLAVGEPHFPSAADGYRAAAAATHTLPETGNVGAGTGATVAKLGGKPGKNGGIGYARVGCQAGTVDVLVVLNAVGDVVNPRSGAIVAQAIDPDGLNRSGRELAMGGQIAVRAGENTTIGAVLIDGETDRLSLHRCCIAAHSALARCVVPSHTLFDGDTMFAVGRHGGNPTARNVLALSSATELAVERAILSLFQG